MLTVEAPAKINLTLEVLGKRPDGYHEIRTILQSLSLHDTLHFEESDTLAYHCDSDSWDAEKSLVSRAARMLQEKFGINGGARISLEKRIALSSGLGGDSSDAAAVIKGLNQLWDLRMTREEMSGSAASLGSDVPFFLDGPTALAKGRGEIITPLPSPLRAWIVLLLPEVRLKESKTGFMYSLLKPEHYTAGAVTTELTQRLAGGNFLAEGDLYNVFEHVVFGAFAGLDRYWSEFRKVAGVPVHLAGAGPALSALFSDKQRAAGVKQALQTLAFNAILTETLSQ
jgi:4-diphosphocytidyl-2-C-methyl-D-erythritol kinase